MTQNVAYRVAGVVQSAKETLNGLYLIDCYIPGQELVSLPNKDSLREVSMRLIDLLDTHGYDQEGNKNDFYN